MLFICLFIVQYFYLLSNVLCIIKCFIHCIIFYVLFNFFLLPNGSCFIYIFICHLMHYLLRDKIIIMLWKYIKALRIDVLFILKFLTINVQFDFNLNDIGVGCLYCTSLDYICSKQISICLCENAGYRLK